MANEVTTKKNTEVSAQTFDYGDMSHVGYEDMNLSDLSIPFINVLQSNSPEVEDQTIEGARSGDLLNSVTQEILKQPIIIQPVYREEVWVEWVPRNKGGGLVDRFSPSDKIVKEVIERNGGSRIPPKNDSDGKRNPFKSPAGNDLIETYYVYCLILNGEAQSVDAYCVLSFSSTKIKVYKDWMTSMFMLKGKPPIFANRAKLSTVKQSNESGSFFNYQLRPFEETWVNSLIPPSTDWGQGLLKEAQNFLEMINSGRAKADDTVKRDDAAPASKPQNDDEIPF